MTVGSEFEGVKPTPPGVGQRLEVRGSKKEARGFDPPTPPANRTLVGIEKYKIDLTLLESVIIDSQYGLYPIFPTVLRRPGLRKSFHPFDLLIKDSMNLIPHVL